MARKKSRGQKVYHYTTDAHMLRIVHSGVIAKSSIATPEPEQAVWFSVDTKWPGSAFKVFISGDRQIEVATEEGFLREGMVPMRIAFPSDVAPVNWRAYRIQSGIDKSLASELERAARERGDNPAFWRVSFDPVPLDNAVGVDAFDSEGGWEPFSGELRGGGW